MLISRLLLDKIRLDNGQQAVAPSGAAPKVLTGAASYVAGNYTEFLANVGTKDIKVTGFYATALSAGIHHVDVGVGAGGAEVAGARGVISAVGFTPLKSARIKAGSRLSGRTTCSAAGGETVTGYFIYVIDE
tara:strand:- start:1498 stop:1893 length:396 start_codon:yes stop_codon:yes gene_type:complete